MELAGAGVPWAPGPLCGLAQPGQQPLAPGRLRGAALPAGLSLALGTALFLVLMGYTSLEDSRMLDKMLRPTWLPQPPVQGRADPRSGWHWPLGHRSGPGDSSFSALTSHRSSRPL